MNEIGRIQPALTQPAKSVPRIAPPAQPNGENCGKCRFFAQLPVEPSLDLAAPIPGMCRRYPPTAQIIGMQQAGPNAKAVPQVGRAVPQVFSLEWCGEFKADEQ